MTVGSRLQLSRVALPMLEQLLAAVESSRLDCPFSEGDLVEAGFRGRAQDVIDSLGAADKAGVVVALRVAIAERIHRPPPRLELVWTGPETKASTAKDTAVVIAQLFDGAKTSIIIGGYGFDNPRIIQPLHAAMAERGVRVLLFLNIKREDFERGDAKTFATRQIDRFFTKLWTFGPPKPDVYYDPRTAGPISRASLHAKCVVVDDERSFLTSANFTDRGQTRNIEAGVLIEDKIFSQELAGHWRQLIAEGMVDRYIG